MNNCEKCQIEFNCTLGKTWNDFTNQFEILTSNDFSGAGTGVAKCKKCELEVIWEHEVFIHDKLYLEVKN